MDRSLEEYRQIVLDMSRASGCTCQPDISFDGVTISGEEIEGWEWVQVDHDDWCQLLMRMSAEEN